MVLYSRRTWYIRPPHGTMMLLKREAGSAIR